MDLKKQEKSAGTFEPEERLDPLVQDPAFLEAIRGIPEKRLDLEVQGMLARKRLQDRLVREGLPVGRGIFYHATPVGRLQSILSKGLYSQATSTGSALFAADPDYATRGVFLASYPEDAIGFAEQYRFFEAEQRRVKQPKKWALLQVTLPMGYKILPDLKMERGYVTTSSHIPARFVKHVRTFEVGGL